ncbi:hypothetical protein ABT263_35885 [Kitasatospora sp. NPDC001603]|uniref:hypothetical protein n=1 Tax=Kitasatospora sp. NPDC001603 TaxID=3154388 RepID=UPI003323484A
MTSTTRFDSLVSGATTGGFDHVRLADGHAFSLTVRPGTDTAEVFLFSGLTAPDSEAWQLEDPWDHWLTGGDAMDGTLFLDVPLDAVRALIVQHGGEAEKGGDDTGRDATGEAL